MRHFNRFTKDINGSTAMLFALSLVPVLGMGAAAVDYSRAGAVKTHMQKAVDATALLLGRDAPQLSEAQLQARGVQVFNAQMISPHHSKLINLVIKRDTRTVTVSASAQVPNVLAKIIGHDRTTVNADSVVMWGVPNTEVALAIDTTGSMRNDMDALKAASEDFTNTILSASDGQNIRMSLVPYVASVNVGRQFSMSAVDTRGESRWHAQALKGRWIGYLTGCNSNPYAIPSSGGGGNWTPPPVEQGPRGSDRSAQLNGMKKTFAGFAHALFGISPAYAQYAPNVTPDTNALTYGGTNYTPGAPFVQKSETGFVPNGFSTANNCWLVNPSRISNLDLFDRIGARWKGCVEARPEPFDVTDETPRSGNPNSLFVPYFWPDEPGKVGEKTAYINNYMNDEPTARGWQVGWDDQKHANLLKYTPTNRPTLIETGSKTLGPNAGCPEELVRLTANKSQIISQIKSLTHVESGGTIASEGVMWGWRTLSPQGVFSDGKPYKQSRKFLVLMSDGINSLQENNRNGPTKTDYSAYGYLNNGRFMKNGAPTDKFVDAENYLTERMELVCKNAKAEGIEVYTILYRETSPVGKDSMRSCASSAKKAFFAANKNELREVFNTIAGEIIKLRITR